MPQRLQTNRSNNGSQQAQPVGLQDPTESPANGKGEHLSDFTFRYRLTTALVALGFVAFGLLLVQWMPAGLLPADESAPLTPTGIVQGPPLPAVLYWWLTPNYELRRSPVDLPDDAGGVWVSHGWPAVP